MHKMDNSIVEGDNHVKKMLNSVNEIDNHGGGG